MFTFAAPYWLLLLLVIPVLWILQHILAKGRTEPTVVFPNVAIFRIIGSGPGTFKRYLSLAIATLAMVLLIVAMARPQSGQRYHSRTAFGIDIILALDISSSMAAMDFNPLTRYEAAKEVVEDFIRNRKSDRIGLVAFSAQSMTICPLTLDYDMLSSFLDGAWDTRIDDGTAIGLAIATSVNRLRNSDAKSKVIILLTDGMNNRGNIDPTTASEMAKALGIRIYTIGVGTEGRAQINIDGKIYWTETHIDEETLRNVAETTGGHYYRAKNKDELQGIYYFIGELETSKINYDEWVVYTELYYWYLAVGSLLLVMSLVLDKTLLRRLP